MKDKSIPPPPPDSYPVIISNPAGRFPGVFAIYKTARGWCEHPIDTIELVAIVTSRRTKQFRPRCMTCGYSNTFCIGYKLLTWGERQSAWVVKIHEPNDEPISQGTCEICGSFGYVEEHHWAPRALFGDEAEQWPTSMLCLKCHRHWHDKVAGIER